MFVRNFASNTQLSPLIRTFSCYLLVNRVFFNVYTFINLESSKSHKNTFIPVRFTFRIFSLHSNNVEKEIKYVLKVNHSSLFKRNEKKWKEKRGKANAREREKRKGIFFFSKFIIVIWNLYFIYIVKLILKFISDMSFNMHIQLDCYVICVKKTAYAVLCKTRNQ